MCENHMKAISAPVLAFVRVPACLFVILPARLLGSVGVGGKDL